MNDILLQTHKRMKFHSTKLYFKCVLCIKVCPMASPNFNVFIRPRKFIHLKESACLQMDSSIWDLSHA